MQKLCSPHMHRIQRSPGSCGGKLRPIPMSFETSSARRMRTQREEMNSIGSLKSAIPIRLSAFLPFGIANTE